MRRFLIVSAVSFGLLLTGCSDDTHTPPSTPAAPVVPADPVLPEATVPEQKPEQKPEPEAEPEPAQPRTRVPKSLVGTWDGDRAKISFSRAGDVTMTFEQNGAVDTGTVVIDGSSMTLHLSGGVLSIADWDISRFDAGYGYEFYNLTLDGSSYVRDVPK